MTQKTLEKLPHKVLVHIEQLRKDYKNPNLDNNICRRSSCEYVRGLMDAGLITNQERQALFLYTTIK